MRRLLAGAVAGLLALGVSVAAFRDDEGASDEDRASVLEPDFGSVEDDVAGTTTSTSAPRGTIVVGGTDAVPDSATSTTAPGVTQALVTDRAGDATLSPIDPPPPWADLLGARLTRSSSGFELRVRLAGGDAPEVAPDGDHTMNVASFYDVDGDGSIDYEIWANIATGGWGGSYFDNVRGDARHQEQSFITVTTEADEVVIRFALVHLDRAERFRWSVASEWGRYEAIGTPAMVRDQVPDGGRAAAFPGS